MHEAASFSPPATNHERIAGEMALKADSLTEQFLTFTIGDAEYGMDIMMIREVKGWSDATRLPGSPDYMRGVLNLRGIVIPIFDLRCRFGLGLTQATEKHVIIILSIGKRIAGLLVDTVSDILTVQQSDIKPAPEDDSPVDGRYVSGLIAIGERLVVVLQVDKLLQASLEHIEMSAHQETH